MVWAERHAGQAGALSGGKAVLGPSRERWGQFAGPKRKDGRAVWGKKERGLGWIAC